MEIQVRIEKVQNGIIFTNENKERFVDGEPKLAINQIVDRILSALDKIGDVTIIMATPDKTEGVGSQKGY